MKKSERISGHAPRLDPFIVETGGNTVDKRYVIGVDYGSESGRAVLVDAAKGEELA